MQKEARDKEAREVGREPREQSIRRTVSWREQAISQLLQESLERTEGCSLKVATSKLLRTLGRAVEGAEARLQ